MGYENLGSIKGGKGDKGDPGEKGLPGVTAISNDAAMAELVASTSATAAAIAAAIENALLEQEGIRKSGTIASVPAKWIVPARFVAWRKAMANVLAGTGNARCLLVGDSTTLGTGAPDPRLNSYPGQLSFELITTEGPVAYSLGIPQQASGSDGRWTAASGWQFRYGNLAIGWGGAGYYSGPAGFTGSLSYTPNVYADTFVVYFLKDTNNPTVPVTIDGVAQAPLNTQSATKGWGKQTYTVANGLHTITFGSPSASGGGAFITGVESYTASERRIHMANAGVGGATAQDWVSTAVAAEFNGAAGIKAYAPDLSIIMLGINDANQAMSVATWQAAMTTLINAAKESGSVIIMSVIPGTSGNPLRSQYRDAAESLAESTGCGFIDIFSRQGTYEKNLAAGFAADEIGHLTTAGYGDVASAVHEALAVASRA